MPDAIGRGELTELLTCEEVNSRNYSLVKIGPLSLTIQSGRQRVTKQDLSPSTVFFGSLCSASGILPTTWYASQRSVGTCVPGKDSQSPHAVDSMDLLYTPTYGGEPLLVHADSTDTDDPMT